MSLETLLKGRRLLVAEDDFFIVEDLLRGLEQAGAEVIGPVANLQSALDLLDKTPNLDGAVLDINLQGNLVFPLADALRQRNIPFVFLTGYERQIIPSRFSNAKHCQKPVELQPLIKALFG